MTAHDQMRRMLDELMGSSRNGEDSRKKTLHFSNHRVCKSFLLNCCPHEILAATRHDLGVCPKIHDVALRADFENSARKEQYTFHLEALKQLRNFVADSERRTQSAKIRLAETQEMLNAQEAARLEKIRQIDEEIHETLLKAEKLGAEGDVENSLKTMEAVEALKQKKAAAEALVGEKPITKSTENEFENVQDSNRSRKRRSSSHSPRRRHKHNKRHRSRSRERRDESRHHSKGREKESYSHHSKDRHRSSNRDSKR
ncbi:putative RNA-binding protein Luc7-like 2 isoform X4 [Stegodyphus dumicola]|uniref:putative RNA-binding protein Luc7-like 2 isoform X4 n=1 Tax=Stegodyphus dumicola TaxID=202533 RepID=UPI0015AFEB6E|nr:putative RNA-binding protein Luc7-like 2 isoform X4 [Stegodyphus dumicola]